MNCMYVVFSVVYHNWSLFHSEHLTSLNVTACHQTCVQCVSTLSVANLVGWPTLSSRVPFPFCFFFLSPSELVTDETNQTCIQRSSSWHEAAKHCVVTAGNIRKQTRVGQFCCKFRNSILQSVTQIPHSDWTCPSSPPELTLQTPSTMKNCTLILRR